MLEQVWKNGARACAALTVASAVLAFGCGGRNPAQPSPALQPTVSTSLPTPLPPPNQPPVIKLIFLSTQPAEVGEEITVTAFVEDAETPVDSLILQWSASKGTITGSGLQVRWRMPEDDVTPTTYEITLTVIEKYVSGGETREQRVSASASVLVHNSPREVTNLTLSFLADFSNSAVPPEVCVRNFSSTCPGATDALAYVKAQRAKYVVVGSNYRVSDVNILMRFLHAQVVAPCEFTLRASSTGKTETVRATCSFLASYEEKQWRLCTFELKSPSPSLE